MLRSIPALFLLLSFAAAGAAACPEEGPVDASTGFDPDDQLWRGCMCRQYRYRDLYRRIVGW